MKKIILSKQFTRERSLFYFYVWNDSDRLGYYKWLGYKIKNSLFVRSGKENKISVWYDNKEIKKMFASILYKVMSDKKLMDKFEIATQKEWQILKGYVDQNKEIKNVKTFKKFYNSLVRWWSVMTIVWYIPDIKEISPATKNRALKMRRESEKYSSVFNYVFENYFKKEFPLYKKYLQIISPREIYVLKDRRFNKDEISNFNKRLLGFGVFNEKIYLTDRLKTELKKKNIYQEHEKINNVDEIKGNIAYAGRVKGRVKLIMGKKLITKLKRGEILVTEMTDPDFLPAMKKSSAIITDEGGVMCHAAIVAREMKMPCIVGTKIATKVLKDGDLVEVDANKGIVKILKRKKLK